MEFSKEVEELFNKIIPREVREELVVIKRIEKIKIREAIE